MLPQPWKACEIKDQNSEGKVSLPARTLILPIQPTLVVSQNPWPTFTCALERWFFRNHTIFSRNCLRRVLDTFFFDLPLTPHRVPFPPSQKQQHVKQRRCCIAV